MLPNYSLVTQSFVNFAYRPGAAPACDAVLLRYGRRRGGARVRGWRIVELRDQPLIAPLLHNNRAARRTGRGHLAVLRPFGLPFTRIATTVSDKASAVLSN